MVIEGTEADHLCLGSVLTLVRIGSAITLALLRIRSATTLALLRIGSATTLASYA